MSPILDNTLFYKCLDKVLERVAFGTAPTTVSTFCPPLKLSRGLGYVYKRQTLMIFNGGQKVDTVVGAVPKATLSSTLSKHL